MGVFAEAEGGLYWSFVEGKQDNNFIYGKVDIGLKITIWGSYKCFGLENHLGKTLSILPEKTITLETLQGTGTPDESDSGPCDKVGHSDPPLDDDLLLFVSDDMYYYWIYKCEKCNLWIVVYYEEK